jgi:secernin
MISFLRDHLEETFLAGPYFNRFLPDFHTVCMHDAPSKFTWGNTVTSMVVEVDPPTGEFIVLFSYQPPCCSMFLPAIVGEQIPEFVSNTGTQELQVAPPEKVSADRFAENSLWWRMYRIVEHAATQPGSRPQELRELFDPIESDVIDRCGALWGQGQEKINAGLVEILDDSLHGFTLAIERIENSWRIAGE